MKHTCNCTLSINNPCDIQKPIKVVTISYLTNKDFKLNMDFIIKTRTDKRHFDKQKQYYKRLHWKILNEAIKWT